MSLVATEDITAKNYCQKQGQYQNDSTQDEKNEEDHALIIGHFLCLSMKK